MIARLTATRRLQFCAGHFVAGHEGKCAAPHGHNYVALITAEAATMPRRLNGCVDHEAEITRREDQLDSIGRVVDFSVLKEKVGGWIDRYWDHGFIVPCLDEPNGRRYRPFVDAIRESEGKAYYFGGNPTAEEMARHLLLDVCPEVLKDTGVVVTKVVLWETENCYAEASL